MIKPTRSNENFSFPNKEIEKIRKDHLNKIKEFKDSLDEWTNFYNKKFENLEEDFNFAKEIKSESSINNFSIKMKTFLKEDVSVIDNYISVIRKSISNKLKGKKKSIGNKIDYITSSNFESIINDVCANLKLINQNISNNKNDKKNITINKTKTLEPNDTIINVKPSPNISPSKPTNIDSKPISILKDFKGEISIKKENFQKLQILFDDCFPNLRSQRRRLYICINTYNYGEKISDNIMKFFDDYISCMVEAENEQHMLIGGSTNNMYSILNEMDRIYFKQLVTVSIFIFESLDEIYNHFENCGITYEKINFK